jgi:hypothetical protein
MAIYSVGQVHMNNIDDSSLEEDGVDLDFDDHMRENSHDDLNMEDDETRNLNCRFERVEQYCYWVTDPI